MRKYGLLLASLLFVSCVDLSTDVEQEEGDGRIAGTITEVASGDPVDNAGIFVHNSDGDTKFGRATTGSYLVARLLPGNYVVEIDPPNGYELAPGTLNNVPVVIVADETKTVNFLLRVAQ